ncbi:peroxiredoxin [Ketogulonicigenium vulgare]|uniref:Glutathione-dependent peroxiredoxin n=1 Tax=Ketogulonicigenium vulgare (strain WSH-001) TaxID=759362 RepID=F9Y7S8_KETVW|nr:peroxiredoxin [Ketogulonicigenium vulgare]ADO41657.1 redoxin [Ketogulonicigenium vulgare Y25]AEM39894.1 Thiol peroxidase (Atypical 2-Cys peroxiredoxin) [Ketogulonicigenium vulgare WSH-001]ALJ80111.1 thiol peroxidase [Ketogulonicigenium vulgare]ANW32981.1 thiol peroxidase [Ketogulonicigenium vulgare]AOZ53588.1 redoxin [Ketogulonicigenium vulgare]
MTIAVGDKLPSATLLRLGAGGVEQVEVDALTAGRKVVIFGLPGPFTGTCTTAHVPSFIRTRAAFADKGVDEVICIAVSDAFVMKAWGDSTGAIAGDISMLADPLSTFTKAIGLNFSNPAIGFVDRSLRYALFAEDGVVKVLSVEENAGQCTISGGEDLLSKI